MTDTVRGATESVANSRVRRVDRSASDQGLRRVSIDTWQDAPHNRWTFAHADEFVTSVNISRVNDENTAAPVLPQALRELVPDLDQTLTSTWSDALIVVNRGELLGEWYADTLASSKRHLLMSVSKSICGILIGTLIDDGLIDPEKSVGYFIPELAASAFGTATVQQVLDMTAAVSYDEEYSDLQSHVRAHDRVAGWRSKRDGDPINTYEFLASLAPSGEHGVRFQYCSANTDVLAWLAEAVTSHRYHDLLSERVWSRLGCRNDARITVDQSGFAFANGGIFCTARDLARVGELMLAGGTLDGNHVVSAKWVEATMAGGDPEAARGLPYQAIHPNGSYKNHWWSTGNLRKNVYAVGIHGQYIWLDVPSQTVIVKFSSAPEALGSTMNSDHARLFGEMCAALE